MKLFIWSQLLTKSSRHSEMTFGKLFNVIDCYSKQIDFFGIASCVFICINSFPMKRKNNRIKCRLELLIRKVRLPRNEKYKIEFNKTFIINLLRCCVRIAEMFLFLLHFNEDRVLH